MAITYHAGRRIQGVPDEYKVHEFTSTGNSTLAVTGSGDIEYLVVAGGGGGYCGGGGAGGMRTGTLSVSAGNKTVTIGTGGYSGQCNVNGHGDNGVGGNSVFDSITSTGGGFGGGTGGNNNTAGGSGGGAGGKGHSANIAGGVSTASPNQGNDGGSVNTTDSKSGGGGGAGIKGDDSPNMDGGNGLVSLISGSSVIYAGGGAGSITNSASGGSGGSGGGGNYNTAGTTNLGAGGGGADSGRRAGYGGSGIVIVRYKTSSGITATGGTITTINAHDARPLNIQLGSRLEETDTRKMYHYEARSQNFASVLSTYAPNFFLKLDEGSGTSLTNSGSTSGYTASITVSNSNPVWDTGVDGANKAVKFTGGSTTGYIGHSQLPTESTGDNFTMGFTFKIPSSFTGGDYNNHHLWQWNNSGLGFWQMNMSNDGYISSAWYNGGWQHLYGTTDVADNAWHTFFITCTSGSSLKGYLDGTQEFTGTANRSGYAGNDVDWLGHRSGNGTISYDNAFFKNSVLTASEISSLHDLLVPATGNVWTEEGT